MAVGSRAVAAAILTILLAGGSAHAEDEKPLPPWHAAAAEYAAGVGMAAVTVPITMELGTMIGKSSSDLTTALVPALVLTLLVPPAAVAGAEWTVARMCGRKGARFHPAVWAGLGVSVLGVLFGALGGVWTENKLSFSLFVVAESLAMPAAITATMKYTERAPKPGTVAELRF
jgi:hypothetical protein